MTEAIPLRNLIFDSSGNAYGTTVIGGAFGCGTVFQLTPVGGGQWQQSVLYSFSCFDDGKNPYGGVTLDAAGNLYGTTVAGGSGGSLQWRWLRRGFQTDPVRRLLERERAV